MSKARKRHKLLMQSLWLMFILGIIIIVLDIVANGDPLTVKESLLTIIGSILVTHCPVFIAFNHVIGGIIFKDE